MPPKRSRPAPEPVRLEMKALARGLVDDDRHGKPNFTQAIERALVNAWKAGRDAAEAGCADPVMEPDGPTEAVPAARLGRKTEAVLQAFGYAAYGVKGDINREEHICWKSHKEAFGSKKLWYLIALDGEKIFLDQTLGDASVQACVKLGLFIPAYLTDLEGNRLPDEVLVATAKTRPTFLQAFCR